MLLTFPSAGSWIVPQPSENIEVTVAKTSQQDNLCLSMGSVDSPLSMCLVGAPSAANEFPTTDKNPNLADPWDRGTKTLP